MTFRKLIGTTRRIFMVLSRLLVGNRSAKLFNEYETTNILWMQRSVQHVLENCLDDISSNLNWSCHGLEFRVLTKPHMCNVLYFSIVVRFLDCNMDRNEKKCLIYVFLIEVRLLLVRIFDIKYCTIIFKYMNLMKKIFNEDKKEWIIHIIASFQHIFIKNIFFFFFRPS